MAYTIVVENNVNYIGYYRGVDAKGIPQITRDVRQAIRFETKSDAASWLQNYKSTENAQTLMFVHEIRRG
jgi:hypothetical protein